MNSSYGTDISAQTSQLRPATFQHGLIVRRYPTWSPVGPVIPNSVFVSPEFRDWIRSPPAQLQGTSRLLSHSLFVERTEPRWLRLKLYSESKTLKGLLRLAESIRRDAKSLHKQGDLDSAFVEYVKAAIIVLEEIPAHPDYMVLLGTKHRHNMRLVSHFYHRSPLTAVPLVHVPYI
jgi:hypothetical protein